MRRLAGSVDELLEACGREDEQEPRWSRVDGVAVRDVPGPKEKRSGKGLYSFVSDLKRQLSLEDPESLVLVMVQMEWCLLTLRLDHLDERVVPTCLLARGLDGGQGDAKPPPRLTFSILEPEGPACSDVFV